MRRAAAAMGAGLALALAPAPAGAAVEEVELSTRLVGGPVLTAGGPRWLQERADRGVVLRALGGARGARFAPPPEPPAEAGLGPRRNRWVGTLALRGEDALVTLLQGTRSARNQFVEAPFGVSHAALAVPGAGEPQELLACGAGDAPAPVALGAGFTVTGSCLAAPARDRPLAVGPVRVDGAVVGTGNGVVAAGPYAAWREADGRIAVYDTRTAAVAGHAAGGVEFAVRPDGEVVAVGEPDFRQGGFPSAVSITPLGGAAEVLEEEGPTSHLSVAPGAIAYAVELDDRQAIVVRRDGAPRRVVAEAPSDLAGVSTDGARVAFDASVRGCDHWTIAIAGLDEPRFDAATGRCPAEPSQRLALRAYPTEVKVRVKCFTETFDEECAGTMRLRRRGVVLAEGTFAGVSNVDRARIALTRAGRALVARGRRFRAELEIVRADGPRPIRVVLEKAVRIVG